MIENFTIPRIECMDSVYAVITQDGVAVYSSYDDMIEAIKSQSVVKTNEDFDYYMEHQQDFISCNDSDYIVGLAAFYNLWKSAG